MAFQRDCEKQDRPRNVSKQMKATISEAENQTTPKNTSPTDKEDQLGGEDKI